MVKEEIEKTIVNILDETDKHLTMSELFGALREKTGTIDEKDYKKLLDELEKNKKIVSIVTVGNIKHYDFKKHLHFHFICDICGPVRNVSIDNGVIKMLKGHMQNIVRSYARIDKLNMSFQGVCHNCSKINS